MKVRWIMKERNRLNNKGFTLVEVLAVIVILVIIVSIAIPNISASLDRQSCTVTKNKADLIASAAQFYVSDNRAAINSKLNSINTKCKIPTDKLTTGGYITQDDLKDGNNETFSGSVVYDKNGEKYTFCFGSDNCSLNDTTCDSVSLECTTGE